METIPKADCQAIGYIQKAHGIKGEIVIQTDPGLGESLEQEPTIFLECEQLLVPYFITPNSIRVRTTETLSLKLDWIDDETHAAELVGKTVHLLHKDLIIDEENFPLHQLIGFNLWDQQLGLIGPIEEVNDYGGNLIFQVHYKNQEILIPFNEDLLIRFDPEAREIELNCPKGLFNLLDD